MSQLIRIYTYKLQNAQAPISLSVTIGNAQAASSMVQLDGKILQSGIQNTFDLPVQDPNSLSGKILDLYTTVTDVNPDSDDISFRIKLSGGQGVFNPPAEKLRVSANGYFQFIIKTIFI